MFKENNEGRHIAIYTDGSCLGNPGVGGWAAAVRRIDNGEEIKKRLLSGSTPYTTNNCMELQAAIEGLKVLKRTENESIVVFSDSEYLVKGMTQWLQGWIAKGWKRAMREFG